MILNDDINKLYADTLGLPQLKSNPKVTIIFFNQDNKYILTPKKIKDFKHVSREDPIYLAAQSTYFLFPRSIILELIPVAVSSDSRVIVLVKILTNEPISNEKIKASSEDVGMQEIYNICIKKLDNSESQIPLHEIVASEKLGWRLGIHRKLIKPLYYFLSNFILRKSILEYASKLSLGKESVICDIASGYDDLAIKIARRYKSIAILNDATSKPLIQMANKKSYDRTIFMNENALKTSLPKVDVLICKNVLHHLETKKEIENMLGKISTLSDVLVIIDPEDPNTTILGKLWNIYYKKFLLDQGDQFMRFDTFKNLISQHFLKAQISIKNIKTIKGLFMVAFVDKRN